MPSSVSLILVVSRTLRFLDRLFLTLSAYCFLMLATLCQGQAAEPADLFRTAASGSTAIVDNQIWDRLLKTYVKAGADGINRVDYAAFKRSGHSQLKAYLANLQTVDPRTLDRSEQFAFLANLYNARTIDIVLDAYPVRSIKDIALGGGGLLGVFNGGPWKAKVVKILGVDLSLDDIEHGILRPVFKDPRVHYSVNCASLGCPNLQMEAFSGARLNEELDAAAKQYVNNSRGVKAGSGGITASSIYSWFKEDFGGADEGVLRHLRKYATPQLAAKMAAAGSIASYGYDWSLNDIRR